MSAVRNRLLLCCAALSGLALAAGCLLTEQRSPLPRAIESVTSLPESRNAALGRDLQAFAEFAEARITRTAEQIESQTTDREVKRAALTWKLELLPDLQEDLAAKEPMRMLIDSWALWIRVLQYLEQGAGSTLFGDAQAAAIETATAILREVERLAREYLPQDRQADILRQINAYAREHPIRGMFEHQAVEDFGRAEQGQTMVRRLLNAPLWAVGRVGEGLDPTARLAQSVDRFTELMRDYPAMLRWETQLLALELERSAAVETSVRSMAGLSDASQQLAVTAEQLPERLRSESQGLLDDLDARQPELRRTVAELREAISALTEAVAETRALAGTVRQTVGEAAAAGEAWTETAHAVQDTVAQIQQFGGTGSSPPAAGNTAPEATNGPSAAENTGDAVSGSAEAGRRPFDIRDYTGTADSLRETTVELRGLLAELQAFLDGDALEQGTDRAGALTAGVLDDAESRGHALIDRLFRRGVEFALLVFALAIAYALIRRHLSGGRVRTNARLG